ncbi:cell division protein SepF [Herbiconiux sp. CPCC 203407]|jgi:cell division inhibitor SepF|uniref:Cell division protein SepF n=1 Tax=Herbiconiux oxytropis TaxID=2970915 RepID=A0AA41XK10_9MICO|nr:MULTISPECIES: cell division protein SepF [Herbiconiux]MCS5722820.1 cell division protein SepF [Herbiconiux oxytropis]MCS5727750.1 cell division protein SepF [Herbiconiux oxytropis]
MANPLRKTMVYLGLADEELEYEAPAERAPQSSPVAPVPHPHQAPQAAAPAQPQAGRAPVTPLRKSAHTSAPKNVAPAEMNEILTVHPKQYKDAQVIAENFRDGIPVIINLSQMTDADARRLIDFAGGLSQGLYGKIERVTSKVFLLSPSHVSVSGDDGSPARAESSFFVQS